MRFFGLLLAFATLGSVIAQAQKTIVGTAITVPQLSTLVSVLSLPAYAPILNLLNSPGNYTVFAPTNDAFAKAGIDTSNTALVTAVLEYHVLGAAISSGALAALQFPNTLSNDANFVTLPGGQGQHLGVAKANGKVTLTYGIDAAVNGAATVVIPDVLCSNGIVHVIDTVLLLPELVSMTAVKAGLSTLLYAVLKANLQSLVDTTAGVTIFAPTNDAFAQIPNLNSLSVAQLTTILAYHVVPAVAFSTDLSNGQSVKTLNGASLSVSITGTGVQINNANVVSANVLVDNGVVHVIDTVLLPPSMLHLAAKPTPAKKHHHHHSKPQ